jgi:hypothetical protein
MGWRSLGDATPCFRRERATFSYVIVPAALAPACLDLAFDLRELLCIAGAQHHIGVRRVLRFPKVGKFLPCA